MSEHEVEPEVRVDKAAEETPQSGASSKPNAAKPLLLGFAGAFVGGLAGYLLFYLILRRGIVVFALPGAMVGLGRALLSRARSWTLTVVCGVMGLGLGVYILQDTVQGGISGASARTVISVIVGAALAAWFGAGRERTPR